MQVSTRCRSTVKRWITDACGSNRIRSHSGRIRSTAPVSSRVSQTARSPGPAASSRTNSWRAPSGHGSGSAEPSRTRRAVLVGESSTSRSAASAAARSNSSGSVGSASASSTTSPAESATPGPSGSRRGRRTAAGEDGRRSTSSVRRHVSRERWAIRRPSTRRCRWTAAASASPSPGASSAQTSGPIRSPARPETSCSTSRASRREQPRTLQVDVRHVDQPGRDQGLEDARVPQAALGLLDVGHRHVRELAHQLVPRLDHLTQLGQPGLRGPPPVGEHLRAQPQREVRVAGEVSHVEQAEGDAQVSRRGLQHAGERADGVVELGARVPERVPDLLGARPQRDVVVRDEHDVEVGVRRQLGPPVPADRDQRGPGVGQRGAGVRLHAPLVGGGGALSSSLSSHVCAVIASPRGL